MSIRRDSTFHHIYTYIYTYIHICILNWRIITLQYCDGFAIHQHESTRGIHVSPPSWIPLPPLSSPHPSRLSQSIGFGFPVSYIKHPFVTYFTYGNVYVSMLFSQIIPPSPSPLCPKICSLCLCILCCPAHRIFDTIFLYSMCVCVSYLVISNSVTP